MSLYYTDPGMIPYPGALTYIRDEERFLAYMQDSIIEPVITRGILSQCIVHKPALLRQLFHLGCNYSGQILSYNKMLGQMLETLRPYRII